MTDEAVSAFRSFQGHQDQKLTWGVSLAGAKRRLDFLFGK